MTLGGRFKLIRNIFNLKIEDFASLLQTQKAYIYNVMRDERGMSESTAQRLLETYGISPEWLKNGEGRMFAAWDKALPILSKKDRFETIDEILPVLEAVSFAYLAAKDKDVSTEYVSRLFEVGSCLLKKVDVVGKENLKDMLPPLLGRGFDERLDKLQLLAGKRETTRGEVGLYISNLVVSLLRRLKEMPREQAQKLSSMLIPWCFWVARQAVSKTFVRVDTTFLGTGDCSDTVLAHTEKGTVVLDYDSSRDEDGRVVLEFSDTFCVTLTTSLSSLYELVYCLENLVFRDIVKAMDLSTKDWGITVRGDAFELTFRRNTVIGLTRNNFSDLTVLGAEIKKNKSLYRRIVSEYLDRYGTI